jgi:hypothetical protein
MSARPQSLKIEFDSLAVCLPVQGFKLQAQAHRSPVLKAKQTRNILRRFETVGGFTPRPEYLVRYTSLTGLIRVRPCQTELYHIRLSDEDSQELSNTTWVKVGKLYNFVYPFIGFTDIRYPSHRAQYFKR